MNVRRWTLFALALALSGAVLASVPLVAHHSSAPFYDATKKVFTDIGSLITDFETK